jgi:EAL domain-containing protein (putative c-di-GMP-specific phosphodiesterase class I)
MDGRISFAAGVFRRYFGRESDSFIGSDFATLIAPGDRSTLALAMSSVSLRGRIPPLALRLNDKAQTTASIACMMMPAAFPRLCFTIGCMPVTTQEQAAGVMPMQNATSFQREAEAMIRAGEDGRMGLVEVKGWQAATEGLSHDDATALRTNISSVLTEAGAGTVAGELGNGRYSLLGPNSMDLAPTVEKLERLIRASPAARHARIEETAIALNAGSLAAAQAARALRFVISRFTEGGSEAAAATGAGSGLSGIIAHAEQRARVMRDTIEQRRFRLVFQPVVALVDRRVHHYEALLRPIPTPGSPAQSTQDFVVFAEAVGLSEELDFAVFAEALTALRHASAASVAVNISGLSMQSAEFRKRIFALLHAESGMKDILAQGRLLAELTETAEIDDMAAAAESIQALRDAGVRVCIDDFGAGAAAFRYLREFRIDFVKIDGAYVRAATESARERGFVASMVELATAANAGVVAEMIETEAQMALMQSLGVQFGQGWLFGKPGGLPGVTR